MNCDFIFNSIQPTKLPGRLILKNTLYVYIDLGSHADMVDTVRIALNMTVFAFSTRL